MAYAFYLSDWYANTDDRNNWSAPAPSAQWQSDDMSAIATPDDNAPVPQKFLRNGQLFIQRGNNTYTMLGMLL